MYGGNWSRIPPSLPRSRSGSTRAGEAAEDLGAELARRPIDAPAVVDRHHVPQVLGQRLELDGMAGHQPERLHVHREALGCPLGPVADELRIGQPVVRRVRLDRVEALGVVADPRLARADAARVPDLRQRLVGPRAGADPDRRAHGRIVGTAGGPGRAQAHRLLAELGCDHGQRALQPHAAAALDVRLDRDGVRLALHRPEAGQPNASGRVAAEGAARLAGRDELALLASP